MHPTSLQELIHFATTKKRHGKSWSFLHVRQNPDAVPAEFGEVRQALEHHFQDTEKLFHDFQNQKDLVMVFHNKTRLAIGQFEKAMRERYGDMSLNIMTSDLNENGLYQFNKNISDLLDPNDVLSRNLLKRMTRMTNVALVLDDDKMILA
ncbi:MAG: hypothetical protein L6Q57_08310, partial [Alphaproteobacteria bacterium]|nr:hypothetical protein [Alphaproteobacteria bacterium]